MPKSLRTDTERWNILQRKAQGVLAGRVFRLFRAAGIEPILIKGLSAARYYPQSETRISIDFDIAVSNNDFNAAKTVGESEKAKGIAIDIHRELRHLDTVEWADLHSHSELTVIEGTQIRMLCAEDNLRVLCVHWLTDGGVNKERLWDVVYAIQNRPANFDWERFLSVVSDRRRRWLVCTVGLAHKYLGLDIEQTPIRDEVISLPPWLVAAVEKEWSRNIQTLPLEIALASPRSFAMQLVRRLRPNPIWATVQMEGSFDARTRVFYQIGNFFNRIPSSFHRIMQTLRAGAI